MRRLIALGALALLLAGCSPEITITDPNQAEPVGVNPGTGGDPGTLAALDQLSVADWASMAGYSRDRFKTWDSQGHSCDTRDVVLQRDGQGVTTGAECKITGGTWVSPYDGATVTNSSDLDIDHIVPLADAWRTGAAAWDDARRESYANDLTRPLLVAVSASSNRSKGDQDPSEWRPENKDFWCTYATDWVTVKAYWGLWVTSAEKSALTEMLGTCA